MPTIFHPPRRAGLALHAVMIAASLGGSLWCLNRATRTPVGPVFAGYVAGFTALALLVLFLLYRLYGLLRGSYSIRTGSLRLVWGLRVEEIPLVDITWVRTVPELDYRLPLPLLRWPGALVGVRRLDRRSRVEFLAADRGRLVVVETPGRAYAISPEDPAAFQHTLQRISEIGVLDPIPGQSVRPGALVDSVRRSRPARLLLAADLVLAAGFAAWILFIVQPVPGLRYPLGDTGRVVNSAQLTLLPVLNSLYFLFDVLLGLFFYRREEIRPLAYVLWISSLAVSVFFFAGVLLLI